MTSQNRVQTLDKRYRAKQRAHFAFFTVVERLFHVSHPLDLVEYF